MKPRENALASAVRLALFSAAIISAPVYAADGDSAKDTEKEKQEQNVEKLQKIQITGSRLRGIDISGASNIQVITRADIEKGGFSNVSQLMDSISANNGALPESFSGGFSDGAKGASLRSMGVNRTLTLINGRRVAAYGFAENLTDNFVDLNSISLGAIERIDILLDGASSIYGSDAITGVVNIIMRNDFDGQKVWADISAPSGGGEAASINYLGGISTDNSNVMASINYQKRQNLTAFDRDYSKEPLKSKVNSLSLKDSRLTYGGPGAPFVLDADTGRRIAPTVCSEGERFTAEASGNTYCLNYSDSTFRPEREQIASVLTGTYNFDNGIELFADAQASYSKSTYVDPNTFVYTPRHTDLNGGYYLTSAYGGPFDTLPGLDPSINAAVLAWQLDDLGPMINESETLAGRLVTGARGYWSLGPLQDWSWEAAGGYSTSRTETTTKNQAHKDRLNDALVSYEYFYIPGLNLSELTNGAVDVTETNSKETLDKIRINTVRKGTSDLYFIDANTTGALFELPSGDVNLVVGAELRWEEGKDEPDDLSKADKIHNFGGVSAEGDRNIKSVYAETNIPLLDTLQAIAAVRYEDYSDFGSTTNPSIKVRYQPADEILFRASWGTGFRAPSIAEKYTKESRSYLTVADPTRCDEYEAANPDDDESATSAYCRATSTLVVAGESPELGPETSENFGFGFVFQPTDSITVTTDYWYVKLEDQINRLSVGYALENEESYGDFIQREATASDEDIADGVTSGELIQVNTRQLNIDEQTASGVDVKLDYVYDHYALGTFEFGFKGSYLHQIELISQFEGRDEFVGDLGVPRWKARAFVDWTWKNDHNFVFFTNYRHPYTDTTTNAASNSVTGEPLRVSSMTTFDLSYQYTGIEDLALSIGVINMLDRDPSFSNFGNAGAAIFTDSELGRTFTGSIQYSF